MATEGPGAEGRGRPTDPSAEARASRVMALKRSVDCGTYQACPTAIAAALLGRTSRILALLRHGSGVVARPC